MADNIKIVGEILNTQQVPRYDEADLKLFSSFTLKEDFGQQNDYIEYFVYDISGNLLNTNYNYKEFKLASDSYVNPVNSSLPIIEIDPIKDLQNLDYTTGEFKVQYNLFNNRVSDSSQKGLFLKEISSDRTELRIGSTVLTNEQIETAALSLISEYTGSAYFVDYLLNFGNNEQVVAVNVALNKNEAGYEILFKLYNPLPDNISEKDSLWVVTEKVNPYIFDINLDKLIVTSPGPKLRGPNFNIDIPNKNNIGTSYQTYGNLVNNLQNLSSSYQQLLSLTTSQSIDINTDYSNFSNFVFFSSAKKRVSNFYTKVQEIEGYKSTVSSLSAITSSYPDVVKDVNSATSSINNIIANFDGFEYYLYFESGSTLTSSLEYGVTPYPKSGSVKPFTLYPSTSTSASIWYNHTTASADDYDDFNQNNLVFTLPAFIKDNEDNQPYIDFVNMVGHYFDNIWIYLNAVTDINLANNNLEKGVSKDLVYTVLQSLGTKLYNKYGDVETDLYLIGKDSGSILFDNNFTITGSYLNNIPRKDLVAEVYKRIYHNLPLLLKTKGTTYGLQTLISAFGITGSTLVVKEYGGDLKSESSLDEFNNDKIRTVTNNIAVRPTGPSTNASILSPHVRLQAYTTNPSNFRINDLNYVDISFSPQDKIDIYTSASIKAADPTWHIDDIIGDPGYLYSSSYNELESDRNTYLSPLSSSQLPFVGTSNKSIAATDYSGFIRLIQFFDNSLFKMLQDFVPARTSLSTGVTISSPILERNKFTYANPRPTSKISVNEGTIDGPTIDTEYTDIYEALTGSKAAYYDGVFSGSVIEYGDEWIEKNINPYLFPTASLTAADIYDFNHSEYNSLLNNVSQSLLSQTRKLLQPIYVMNSPLSLAGYSSSYYAELQDSYESLKSYELSRYEGVKIFSLKYNNYTSASDTYGGDESYGKTAVINRNARKLGLFTEIVSSSFLPGRNRIALKYLVDEFGGLTELNQRNKHWEEVQRTFVTNNYLNVSQFDNQKYSNQKTTDGDKLIFDSGYSYYPILYFTGSCTADSKIYFENLGGSNSYLLTAKNGLTPPNISGSSNMTIRYPLKTGNVYNIFDTAIEGASYYTPGTTTAFPEYTVQESGDHRVAANFTLYVTMSNGGNQTWTLGLYKNGSLIPVYGSSVSKTFNLTVSLAATSTTTYYSSYSCTYPSFDYFKTVNGVDEGLTPVDIPINGGPAKISAGTRLYSYNFKKTLNTCTISDSTTFYSTLSSIQLQVYDSCRCGPSDTGRYLYYSNGSTLYEIPNFTTNASGKDSYTFDINLNPVSSLAVGDKIIPKFTLDSTDTNDFTASISEGSLTISSLSVATGYASTTCPYFNSGSISSSVANSDRSTITLSAGLSNFHNRNYQFVPNPLTGSMNSLYSGSINYGDVDYPFNINPYDIIVTYLSDSTYVESRVLSVATSASLLQIRIDNQMSNLQVANLQSGSYQRFLVLKRVEDETNAYLTFKKRAGKTSYGFVIPENISPEVLNNIDTITKEVKQKLLADQQGTTI